MQELCSNLELSIQELKKEKARIKMGALFWGNGRRLMQIKVDRYGVFND